MGIFILPCSRALATPLSLDDAIAMALKNHLDIKIADLESERAQAFIHDAKSLFDVTLSSTANWTHDQDKPASTLSGRKTQTGVFNIGLSKKIPLGTKLGVSIENTYKDSDSSVASKPTYWDPKFKISATQELLKNSFGTSDRKERRAADLFQEASLTHGRDLKENVISEISKLYWTFVAHNDIQEIQKQALDRAQKLYEANLKKIKLGTIEKTDLLASQASVLARKADLLSAQDAFHSIHEDLKRSLKVPLETSFEPKNELVFTPKKMDAELVITRALTQNKTYHTTLKELRANELKLKIAKNNFLPEFNLEGSIAFNGLAKEFESAWSDVSHMDFPTYYYGVTLSYPLGEHASQRTYLRQWVETEKAHLTLEKLKDDLRYTIRQEIRTLDSQAQKVGHLFEVQKLLYEKMKEEEKKFNQGRSSINFVIQFQEDHLQSSKELIFEKLSYQKALIDLKRRQGALIETL
ncbi:MAG: TolC family protein [Deltaproteobacteria bacterium]|nr:TolC family protein [Deltaproteobacteria bacterium]